MERKEEEIAHQRIDDRVANESLTNKQNFRFLAILQDHTSSANELADALDEFDRFAYHSTAAAVELSQKNDLVSILCRILRRGNSLNSRILTGVINVFVSLSFECDNLLTLAEPEDPLALLLPALKSVHWDAHESAVDCLNNIVVPNENKLVVLNYPELFEALTSLITTPHIPSREVALTVLYSVANSAKTVPQLAKDTELLKTMMKIAESDKEPDANREHALSYIGNLVHWGDEEVRGELRWVAPRLTRLMSKNGYIGLRSTTTVVILNPADSTRVTPNDVRRLLGFFGVVMRTGTCFDMDWEKAEVLFPLQNLWQFAPHHRKLIAQHQTVEFVVAALRDNPTKLEEELASQLLVGLVDFLAASGAMRPQTEAHLRELKSTNSLVVRNCATRLLLRTADQKRWHAFCMVNHRRLGANSPFRAFPVDLLPLLARFL